MSRIATPTNDNSRSESLSKMHSSATADRAKGNNYIFEGTLNKLATFAPLFSGELDNVSASKSSRIRETAEKNSAYDDLVMCTRHACHSIHNRVTRRNESPEVYAFYQMSSTGTIPRLRPDLATLGLAKRVVAGDSTAIAAGFEPMVNPDASELSGAIANVEREMAELTEADREYDEVSEGIAELRIQADDIIADVIDELQFHLRKMDSTSARRIMRSYGIRFKNSSSEEEIKAQ